MSALVTQYRGWTIEPTNGVQLGYVTETGKSGKGRKASGYILSYPTDSATKYVSTVKAARAYIDEYMGEC